MAKVGRSTNVGLRNVLSRAIADPLFAKRLVEDVDKAVGELGVELSTEEKLQVQKALTKGARIEVGPGPQMALDVHYHSSFPEEPRER